MCDAPYGPGTHRERPPRRAWGRRRATALAVALLAAGTVAPRHDAVAAESSATPPTAPDVVMLKDGGMLRGTIAELTPRRRVVILLVTGEKRTIAMKDVAYAGPAAAAPATAEAAAKPPAAAPAPGPPAAAFPPPASPGGSGPPAATADAKEEPRDGRVISGIEQALLDGEVREIHPDDEPNAYADAGFVGAEGPVHFESARAGLHVFVTTSTGSATVFGSGGTRTLEVEQYRLLCVTPCTASLPAGTYRFAVAPTDGDTPTPATRVATVSSGDTVRVRYDSRKGLRAAGVGIAAVGGTVGAVLIATTKGEGVVAGAVIAGASLTTGLILLVQHDDASVRVGAGQVSAAVGRTSTIAGDPGVRTGAFSPGLLLQGTF